VAGVVETGEATWKWLEMTDMTARVSRLMFSMQPHRLLSHTPLLSTHYSHHPCCRHLRKRVITAIDKFSLRWME
jgi:hypothetical protein